MSGANLGDFVSGHVYVEDVLIALNYNGTVDESSRAKRDRVGHSSAFSWNSDAKNNAHVRAVSVVGNDGS